jgi:hypothetical protein
MINLVLRSIFFSYFPSDYLHAINLTTRGGSDFTSPQEEGVVQIFIALKNPSPLPGFEPTNLGSNDNHDRDNINYSF